MKLIIFLLVATTAILPKSSFGQNNQWIHTIRSGNIKSSTTTYNRTGTQESSVSIDKILENPKLVCDMPNSEVVHFTITLIPKGQDLYGPFSTNGNELSASVKNKLLELKDAGTKTKIVVESIQINKNGKTETVSGALFYVCK